MMNSITLVANIPPLLGRVREGMFLLLFVCIPLSAQVNLDDDRLDGIELEIINDSTLDGIKVFRDLTYWNLFTSHERGWTGADGDYSVSLPDGNTLWLFGDTMFGAISEYRNRDRASNMPRNSAMIQTDEHSVRDFHVLNEYVSTDPTDSIHYYMGKTWVRHPQSKLTDAQINQGTTDQQYFYWPGDGTVIYRNGEPVVQVIMRACTGSLTQYATGLAEFSLEGNVGDEKYMQLTELYENIVTYSADYGTSLYEDADGHTYIYGAINNGYFSKWGIVARSETHDLTSTWSYYIKDSKGQFQWQTNVPTEVEMRRSAISSVLCIQPSVFKYGDYYYMVTQQVLDDNIVIARAEHPWGPFTDMHKIYSMPREHWDTYFAIVHPQLSRTGELLISYSMNPGDITIIEKDRHGFPMTTKVTGFSRNFNARGSADLYEPHFIRVFGWQSLFGETNIGPITDVPFYR